MPEDETRRNTLRPVPSFHALFFLSKVNTGWRYEWLTQTRPPTREQAKLGNFGRSLVPTKTWHFIHMKFHFFLRRQKAVSEPPVKQMAHQGVQSLRVRTWTVGNTALEMWPTTFYCFTCNSKDGYSLWFAVWQAISKGFFFFLKTLLPYKLVPSCEKTKQVFEFLREVRINVVFSYNQ